MKAQNARTLARSLALATALGSASATAIDARRMGVVVNADDPHSAAVASAFARARGIVPARIVSARLGTGGRVEPAVFMTEWNRVDAQLGDAVQALALAWTRPWRVDCMSVTSAFAFGYDTRHCAGACEPTAENPWFNSTVAAPWTRLQMRPAMLLAGSSPAAAQALVERGVRADGTRPTGTAYLLSTSDRARNVRAAMYEGVARSLAGRLAVRRLEADTLTGRTDVFAYVTGLKTVDGLDSLRFLPGAVADHLTSAGGVLEGGRQMSVLRWLDAGATGSYGAVVEPCNFTQKFPDPRVLLARYRNGEPLISAYWKSVRWPGQGLFVGAPLARPFGPR